jgi:hypothetical protein
LQYVLWITTFNVFFLLLYMIHDFLFFPSTNRKPRATDAAAQLGPTAPTTSTDTWAASTSTSLARPSLSTESSYVYGEAYGNSRPGSRQGFLTVDDAMSAVSEGDAGGEHGVSKRRKTPRRSWDGSDVNPQKTRTGELERSPTRDALVIKEEALRKTSPELLEGINRNGLVIFLLVRGVYY